MSEDRLISAFCRPVHRSDNTRPAATATIPLLVAPPRLAGGIADAFPGEDGVAGQGFDQIGEGQAAGHVGVEVWFCRTQRAEASGGGCLGGGHDGGGDGADFHADTAREGEPIGLGREVEGEH